MFRNETENTAHHHTLMSSIARLPIIRLLTRSVRWAPAAPLSTLAPAPPPPAPKAGRPSRPRAPPVPDEELSEIHQRGSGAGGQAVAKTSNAVLLKHLPTGTVVRCHATRSLATNRALARREMALRLDEAARGADSVRGVTASIERRKASKAGDKARRKAETRAAVKAVFAAPPRPGE